MGAPGCAELREWLGLHQDETFKPFIFIVVMARSPRLSLMMQFLLDKSRRARLVWTQARVQHVVDH
jgi:hypothetical protein